MNSPGCCIFWDGTITKMYLERGHGMKRNEPPKTEIIGGYKWRRQVPHGREKKKIVKVKMKLVE
jgi:hypothetical protein